MLAEKIGRWNRELREKALQEGRQEGEARLRADSQNGSLQRCRIGP